MAATGRSIGDLAATLSEAPFVRVAPRADGDAIAAAGLLIRSLADRSIPFQARVVAPDADPPEGEGTVPIGFDGPLAGDRPVSAAVADVVRELGGEPDPALALAGCLAAGTAPSAVSQVPFERREGVGIPTADPVDGFAHSTLVHAGFSGDEEAATGALAGLDADGGRAVASLLALETASAEGATPRAADRLERALRPHATPGDEAPFETVEGYADVLDCLARDAPGLALALVAGHDVRSEALEAWRDHATAAHRGLREASTDRYDGLSVARVGRDSAGGDDPSTEGRAPVPVGTIARLFLDFRSPEPIALAVASGQAAAAGVEGTPVDRIVAEAAGAVGGTSAGTERRAEARFDGDPSAFVDAAREAVRS
jgi:hypothetical protein